MLHVVDLVHDALVHGGSCPWRLEVTLEDDDALTCDEDPLPFLNLSSPINPCKTLTHPSYFLALLLSLV